MAYKRKAYRKYVSSKKRRLGKASTSVPPKLNSGVRNRGEVKYEDFTVSGTIASGAISNSDLTGIAGGSSFNQRIGKKIHILGYDLMGTLGGNGALCDIHVISMYNNANPAIGNFRPSVGGPLDHNLGKTWWHRLGGNANAANNNLNASYRFKYPVEVVYNGTATTAGIRNRIFLSLVSQGGVTVGTISLTVRVYFQDS